MSIIIFFGVALLVIFVGFIYVGVGFRHHWKNGKKAVPRSPDQK